MTCLFPAFVCANYLRFSEVEQQVRVFTGNCATPLQRRQSFVLVNVVKIPKLLLIALDFGIKFVIAPIDFFVLKHKLETIFVGQVLIVLRVLPFNKYTCVVAV